MYDAVEYPHYVLERFLFHQSTFHHMQHRQGNPKQDLRALEEKLVPDSGNDRPRKIVGEEAGKPLERHHLWVEHVVLEMLE